MIGLLDIVVFSTVAASVGIISAFVARQQATLPGQASLVGRLQQASIAPVAADNALRVRRDTILANDTREDSLAVRFDRWFEWVLIRAGIGIDRQTCSLLIGCIALTGGATAFTFGLHPIIQIIIVVVALPAGIATCFLKMVSRINKFSKQFPASLELLARATRAGENLEGAFRIAGESSSEPIKGEFLQCVRQMDLGLPPDAVATDLARRIDTVDVHLLSHTIALHQSMGGRLADSLERLSDVIRDRSTCEQKVKSMTSIARFAIISIVLMGMFVLVYLLMAEPDYINKLFSSSLGHKMLIYAAVSEIIGLIWVGFTLKSDL